MGTGSPAVERCVAWGAVGVPRDTGPQNKGNIKGI